MKVTFAREMIFHQTKRATSAFLIKIPIDFSTLIITTLVSVVGKWGPIRLTHLQVQMVSIWVKKTGTTGCSSLTSIANTYAAALNNYNPIWLLLLTISKNIVFIELAWDVHHSPSSSLSTIFGRRESYDKSWQQRQQRQQHENKSNIVGRRGRYLRAPFLNLETC